jgi:hypothetical protein
MIRSVVDRLADNAALEVPVDAITAVARGLNGLLESMQLDLISSPNATDTNTSSIVRGEQSMGSESDDPEPSVKSSTTSIGGGVCPTDLFEEGEELAQVMSDAIKKAALKAISEHVPGESPLEVASPFRAPLSRSRLH